MQKCYRSAFKISTFSPQKVNFSRVCDRMLLTAFKLWRQILNLVRSSAVWTSSYDRLAELEVISPNSVLAHSHNPCVKLCISGYCGLVTGYYRHIISARIAWSILFKWASQSTWAIWAAIKIYSFFHPISQQACLRYPVIVLSSPLLICPMKPIPRRTCSPVLLAGWAIPSSVTATMMVTTCTNISHPNNKVLIFVVLRPIVS